MPGAGGAPVFPVGGVSPPGSPSYSPPLIVASGNVLLGPDGVVKITLTAP